ncbi:glycosyl transferase family 2 [Poseidonocella sp. HB161398]|uniref:glycosyl transferase family 2 n=1 Tax=Poseidonocella sp. HB161398 TaxID=2320855 RepID=UPI00197E1D45|nr:glycosyl transferase family 2 [Poseidonocella sp. HB161398]
MGMLEMDIDAPHLSVLVAAKPMKELPETLRAIRPELDALGMSYEIICATDGSNDWAMSELEGMAATWPNLITLGQRPWSDDDAALAVALRRARGSLVLTLAGWPEVDPADIHKLFDGLGSADIVSAVRLAPAKSGLRGWRTRSFTGLLTRLFGQSPTDPFCRTRLAHKSVLDDVAGFGVRQHFIPTIAGQRGYKLAETQLRVPPAGPGGDARFIFSPFSHLQGFLDAMTLYVVLKYLRRPLRFFGSIGFPLFAIGALATTVLVLQRLFGEPLSDRPALAFAVLMLVLGIQIIAIGLVGEIIIYANARRMKQYAVKQIIGRGSSPASLSSGMPGTGAAEATE